MSENKIKITPAKGRPMLNWVGKKPLDYVKGFPSQLIETFDPLNSKRIIEVPTFEELKDNWQNLLFHGDNKDVLATLLELGFRGKIDLIYIDPPFKSGADYVRKVELRGLKNLGQIQDDEASILQQTMYFDIWNNDSYLQFMYERLMLLKELLSETGSIYVHLDWHVGHYIKLLMDEMFGQENFRSEIVWRKLTAAKAQSQFFSNVKDTILFYSKDKNCIFNSQFLEGQKDDKNYPYIEKGTARRYGSFDLTQRGNGPPRYFGDNLLHPPTGKHWILNQENINKAMGEGRIIFTSSGLPRIKRYLDEKKGNYLGDLWIDNKVAPLSANDSERLGFETQKPEALLERIIKASTKDPEQVLKEGENIPLILDCFCGSGTTTAVAQKLGRRWIGCDINKGAVQITSKRLQKIIIDQIKNDKENKKQSLLEEKMIIPKYNTFAVYKVNDYDLKLLKTEAIELAIQHIGIQRIRTDRFFDGYLGKTLVKIIDFNHPLTLLDLQLIQDELKKRPNEDREITIICLGKELTIDPWVEEWNKKHPVNKIRLIELKTDKKYGNFLIHQPAEAKVKVERTAKNKALIEIQNFISPTIIERLNIDNKLFKVKIPDFRSMIDTVLIDTNYNGNTFLIVYSDVPEKKTDLVKGKYEIEIPADKAKIAVKIIDMLGEEVLNVFEI